MFCKYAKINSLLVSAIFWDYRSALIIDALLSSVLWTSKLCFSASYKE